MNAPPVSLLRPLAKVVAISDSILKKQTFSGMMARRRWGPKESNQWRQFITPEDPLLLPGIRSFMVEDPKIKSTEKRRVQFMIKGWRDR